METNLGADTSNQSNANEQLEHAEVDNPGAPFE